jgi:hypothetical protein
LDVLIPTLLLVLELQEPLETITLLLNTPRRPRMAGEQLGIDLRLGQVVDVDVHSDV